MNYVKFYLQNFFGTGCSEQQLIGWEIHEILLQEFLSVLVAVKLTKLREKYSKFGNFWIPSMV